MFDRFTQHTKAAAVTELTDQLASASGLLISAIERFYDRILAGEDFREAYVVLEDELDSYRGPQDERFEGVDPRWAIRRAFRTVESRRRDDDLRNPYIPRSEEWKLAEYVLDRVGQRITLADIQVAGTRRYGGKVTGPGFADVVAAVANDNPERLIPIRTKVGGKVAYGVYENADSEPSSAGVWRYPKEIA